MSDLVLIIILGVVQGITEFLPISSDGHLVLVGELLSAWTGRKLPEAFTVTIVLHIGTLLAILVVYWQRLLRLLSVDRRALWLVIAGTIPAVLVGLPLRNFDNILESPLLAAIGLLVTGVILLWGSRYQTGQTHYTEISYSQALIIGAFQALAILPGVSRSGSTISSALWLGLSRESAASFSFLLAVPAIAGAATLEILKHLLKPATESTGPTIPVFDLIVGGAVSFVVGLVALTLLLRVLNRGQFAIFAWWCIPVGLAALAWQLAR